MLNLNFQVLSGTIQSQEEGGIRVTTFTEGIITPVRFSDWAALIIPVTYLWELQADKLRNLMSTRYLTLMICLQHCQGVKSSLNSISIMHINRFCLMRSQRSILLFTLQRDSFSINIYLLVYHQLLRCFNTPWRVYCRICLVYVYILVTGINEEDHLNNLDKVM